MGMESQNILYSIRSALLSAKTIPLYDTMINATYSIKSNALMMVSFFYRFSFKGFAWVSIGFFIRHFSRGQFL
jgi:hypothetical protein